MRTRLAYLFFLATVLLIVPSVAVADPRADVERLTDALDRRLTVWTTPRGRHVHIGHCRFARGGCEARLRAFADIITEAADRTGIDAYLLAAIAVRESGLNPAALGAAGERGIVQLHPQGVGARVRYVRDENYRTRCLRTAEACQTEVVQAGATLLSEAIQHCGGLEPGLGMYNAGVCDGERDYVRRVLAERERLTGALAVAH